MKAKKLTIEFKINLKNFVPEFSIRLFYLIICILIIKANYKPSESENSYLIASLFIFLNIVISALTIYSTHRQKSTIVSFIKMRIKNHDKYNDFEINKKIDFNLFYVFSLIAGLLFCGSTICIFSVLDLINPENNNVLPIIILFILPLYTILVSIFKFNFISSEIKSISVDGKKLSSDEISEIKTFLKKKNETQLNIYYENDSFLFEQEEKSNIFKHRIDTLLIEAVFIGALTFGTFIQLTSPESITTFENIQEKESKVGFEKDAFFVQQRNRYRKKIFKIIYKKDLKSISTLNPDEIKSLDNLLKVAQYESNFNEKKINKIKLGFFINWSRDRQQTIFSWLYKKYDDQLNTSGIIDIFDLNAFESKNHEKEKAKNKKYNLNEIKYTLEQKYENINNLFSYNIKSYQDSLSSAHEELATLEYVRKNDLHSLCQLLLIKDQLELIKFIEPKNFQVNKNPYNLDKTKNSKALEILHFHNKEKFKKLYNITKEKWDELEYFFFIAIGSIICSVLYISVLILRFPIILSIERLLSNIKKANMWNQREENMLANVFDYKIQNSKDDLLEDIEKNHILKELDKQRKIYTDRLQIQLSKCEIISSKIETKIQIISFLRNLGLYTFFLVVLISTMMIEPKFTIFLASILIYTMLISSFMEENGNLRTIWRKISHPNSNEDDEIIDSL